MIALVAIWFILFGGNNVHLTSTHVKLDSLFASNEWSLQQRADTASYSAGQLKSRCHWMRVHPPSQVVIVNCSNAVQIITPLIQYLSAFLIFLLVHPWQLVHTVLITPCKPWSNSYISLKDSCSLHILKSMDFVYWFLYYISLFFFQKFHSPLKPTFLYFF